MAEPLALGARASVDHVFSADDVAAFARLSGDDNPIHLAPDAARTAGFDRPLVHGVLVVSLLSRLLGTRLPGPGTVLLGQNLRFRKPVYPDDRLRATVEVIGIREDKPIITLRTWVESDDVVVDGESTVLVRELAAG
jgi:acyl dehydratase